MKLPFLLSAFLLFTISSTYAQDLIAAKDIHLNSEQDFKDFEGEVLKYIDWLATHSLDDLQRADVNAALLIWISDTPTLTISLNSYVMDYTKKNPDFLMLFMAGWSKFVINHPEAKSDPLKCNLAGVQAILDYYPKGKKFGIKKDKKIAKLLKIQANNNLEKFIKDQL